MSSRSLECVSAFARPVDAYAPLRRSINYPVQHVAIDPCVDAPRATPGLEVCRPGIDIAADCPRGDRRKSVTTGRGEGALERRARTCTVGARHKGRTTAVAVACVRP
ncbi:MAG: hypothetical protein ACK559_29665, partial [bacterium]